MEGFISLLPGCPGTQSNQIFVYRRVVLKGVGRLSGECAEAVWSVWGGCMEGVVKLSGVCGEAIWRVWGGSLEGVGRLS